MNITEHQIRSREMKRESILINVYRRRLKTIISILYNLYSRLELSLDMAENSTNKIYCEYQGTYVQKKKKQNVITEEL